MRAARTLGGRGWGETDGLQEVCRAGAGGVYGDGGEVVHDGE